MLNILLMIILIIILFIIILLYIGVKVSLKYDKTDDALEGCLNILVLKKIKIYSLEYPSQEKEKSGEKEDKSERNVRELFELAKPCLDDLKLFLKELLKSMHISKLQNHLVFGLDSYADTGTYIGIIWGFLSIVNSAHENARLSAEPSFNGSVINSYGEADLEINILKLVMPTLRLVLKKEIRTLIKGVLNG